MLIDDMNISDIEFDGTKIPALAKGKSLNQIAIAVGISRQFMGEIARGVSKPSTDVALRIARVLECSVNDFSNEKNLSDMSATA
jgi:transcriptional regulator with XRE-family HTH domain